MSVLCDGCSHSCQGCDRSFCSGCLSTCSVCGYEFCSSCLETCRDCRKRVCDECREDGLCRHCHDKQQEENQHDSTEESSARARCHAGLNRSDAPILRFSPTAWAKLLFLRDAGDTEVGGFGISAADDLLLIEDVQLVRQVCDLASVAFDDASVADFFDRQVDAGVSMARCGRVWLHTHPGILRNRA